MNVEIKEQNTEEQYLQYRSLCGRSVAAFIIGIIALPALLLPAWGFWGLLGLPVGVSGYLRVRNRQHEFTGLGLAKAGIFLCAFAFFGGLAVSVYTYMTEVPEGYVRISFADLQPDKDHPELPIPPSALGLNGEKVFVPGYVHKAVTKKTGIKRFILVPDMKTCCFGGQPELTDMIEVTLQDPLRINYSFRRRRLGGTLKVSKTKKSITDLNGVYYELDADYVARPGK